MGKLSYFDYLALAENEYRNLLKKHPELTELSNLAGKAANAIDQSVQDPVTVSIA